MARSGSKKPTTLEQACGRVISRYREKSGLSQMDLAVATGYSLRYVGDVERGTKSATLRTMNDLATLLNVRLETIIHEAESLLGNKDKEDRADLPIGEKSSSRRRQRR